VSFPATVLKVLIASPRDTLDLRDHVERSLHEWNADRGEAAGVLLLPRRWETNAVPQVTGTDGQTVVNAQLVADADIVIGIFHATLGRATPRAPSGTAEELATSHAAGKPVHIYFSSAAIPREHDREQLAALDAFKDEMAKRSLYGSFDTPGSLGQQVKSAIEFDLAELDLKAPSAAPPRRGASLRIQYEHDRELNKQGRMTTRRERLRIINDGDELAENVTLELQSGTDGVAPSTWGAENPFTLAPFGGTYSIAVATHAGMSQNITGRLRWTENSEDRESSQSVSFH